MAFAQTCVDVRIEGKTPLLQHRYTGNDNPKPPKTENERTAEAGRGLYTLDDGTIYQPGEHIHKAMVKAGAAFQVKGRGKLTYKTIILGGLAVHPDCISHEVQEWTRDDRPVVIGKARIMRCRPRFDEWALEFQLRITAPEVHPTDAREILDHAGEFVGIGDNRPINGKFMVTKWEVVESDNGDDS